MRATCLTFNILSVEFVQEGSMKRSVISKSPLLCLVLLAATTAFAPNKKSVAIPERVTVNGKSLAAGNYKVEWESSSSNVGLSFLQYNKFVAAVPARFIDLQQPDTSDSVLLGTNGDGSRSLQEVHSGGKRYALVLRSDEAEVGPGQSANK